MTVQQINNPSTRKGDPLVMKHLNTVWRVADTPTKQALQPCVQLDGNGNIVHIAAIKDYAQLESFVRSFADGKTYIGNGAWNGSPGNDNDNKQSSAAQGSTDIRVTYNDGNATSPS